MDRKNRHLSVFVIHSCILKKVLHFEEYTQLDRNAANEISDKVRKKAVKIRNRYNQVPHLTQDTA